eukprot:jgi/Psemu1/53076/gm1.53076_g
MRNTIHISRSGSSIGSSIGSNTGSNSHSNHRRTSSNHEYGSRTLGIGTMTAPMDLPTIRRLRRSFLFCLLLLLSICSATESFQQFDGRGNRNIARRQQQQQRQRTTVGSPPQATSIADLTPLIGVYGGEININADEYRPRRYRTEQQQRRRRRKQQQRQQQTQTQKQQKKRAALDEAEYQRRKQEWADRYTTLEGLRETFGSNRNKVYGDLDVATTRRLYKSLLPTAVCELVLDVEVKPEELAQLAYEARKAAKLYARERCHVPARLFANCYDGVRSFRRYGRFQVEGMSYDQLFDKYYQRSALERSRKNRTTTTTTTTTTTAHNNNNNSRAPRSRWQRTRTRTKDFDDNDEEEEEDWDEQDIVTQTCMKILESACRTNPAIDRLALSSTSNGERRNKNKKKKMDLEDMEKIAQTLEDDVRKLLDPYSR